MKIVIQRVTDASVAVDNKQVAIINHGMLVLVGLAASDTQKDLVYIKNKLFKLRIFQDEEHKMNKSVIDIQGDILLVSQFTLYGDCTKGNRPSFISAMPSAQAKQMYNDFVAQCQQQYPQIFSGIFGANMHVTLTNDGPVTLILDSKKSSFL